jgi:UDP-N-acetylmuramoylalanine--D-glutamate ligase
MGMTMRDYLSSLKNKKVAVIGIGVSNTPLIKTLRRNGIDVTACDKNERGAFDGLAEELESLGAKLQLGPDYLSKLNHHVIFRTPGMRPDLPELQQAAAHGSVITSEMEAFFEVCPCEIIGVTGSDGKTTTTTIIAELLRAAGYNVYLGGNIGRPLFTDAAEMVPDDFAVLELSSFQLMTMEKSPSVAVVTNLAPNHLDVHTSMSEYIAAKENIFIHQSAEGKAVFNLDNEITKAFASKAKGKVLMFSRKEEVPGGIYVKDGSVWSGRKGFEREILPLKDILLPGDHNVENYMAAIAAVEGLVGDQVIRDFAASFTGVEHRIELVRTLDGVTYYNDRLRPADKNERRAALFSGESDPDSGRI